jgi:hypothetical protein
MSERAYDRLSRKHEREDRARLTAAFEVIERDTNLRFLLWQILSACGMASDPFTTDPLTTAHNCGKMSIGQDLLALTYDFAPNLYPALISEMTDEQRNRTADLDDRLSDD